MESAIQILFIYYYFYYLLQEQAAVQEAKQLLIKQKLDLQSQLMDKETALNKAEAEHAETKEVAHKVQTMLRDESAALQNKLVSLK